MPYAKTIPVILAGVLIIGASGAMAASGKWSPQASDRLMKLSGSYLKKAVENDFAKSELGAVLTDTDQKIGLKKDSLADLQAAIRSADGELKIELEYQFLTEKKRYIELMRDKQDLRRRRAQTKIRLYENLLQRVSAVSREATPARAQLIANQKAARDRLAGSVQKIDTKLFQSTVTAQSKYAGDYAKNLNAIESLVQAINAHPMNRAPEIDGRTVSQADYLRQLISENEADVALVDQERAILGYMAKLVSLDALALSEGVRETDGPVDAPPAPNRLTSSLEFFVTR